MSYAESHVLLTAHGVLPSGSSWSCGVRTGGDGGYQWTQPVLNAMALQAANAWRSFQNTTGIGWPAEVSLDGVTARYVSAAGKTQLLAERSPSNAAAAPNGVLTLPSQCAVVMTLVTALPMRTAKGRIYLPLLGITASAANKGRIAPTTVTAIVNAGRGLIIALNNAVDAAYEPASPLPKISVQTQVTGAGVAPVTGVRVGDVIDTQRRRRDNAFENYTSLAL
jgi:hypothetical protein